MKFIYLGQELNPDTEYELFSKSEFGVNAKVTMNNGDIVDHNNCTEIHYKYFPCKDSIAFESDIHKSGIAVSIDKIKSIIVEEAILLEDTF